MPRKMLLALAIGILFMPAAAFAQDAVITGVVRSNAQAPVPGAFVAIQSLNMQQVTNDYGQYRFVIPAAQVNGQVVKIEARSIGFNNAEATVTLRPGTITQNITMVVRAIQLDEVVVTGTAGRTERRAQAAVVASIDAARVAEVAPVTTVAGLLQARTPGVVLRNNSGTNGTYTDIRIRGVSSISLSNEPLIYVDGIRVSGGQQQIYGLGGQSGSRLNDIKIEDIESMDVVKGPAAATLYGSDAVAGVINIITKKGRAGSGFVQTLNVEYGESSPNFTAPDNYGRCDARALSRPTTYPSCVGLAEGTILHDNPLERDDAFGNGRWRNLNYSLSGGGEKFDAYFSLGADGDDGTVPNNYYGHTNTRANFGYLVRENLRMEFGFGLMKVNTQLPNNDNNIYGYLGGGMLGDPRTIGGSKDGWYARRQTLATSSIENTNETTRFQPRGVISYSPMRWFTNTLTVGADMSRTEAMSFWAKNDQHWWDSDPMNTGQVGQARRAEDRLTVEYLGRAYRNLTDDLRFDFAVGSQVQTRRTDLTNATGQGLVNNDVRSVNAAAELLGGGQSSSQSRDIGVFGEADFSWRERVYLQTGLRRDQSSSFGADSKPFYLPKIGLSWVISDEDFFRNTMDFMPDGAITQLRLRGAWGISGRQPTSGARSTYNPSTNLIGPGEVAVGVRPGSTGNPQLRAEKSKEWEFGVDGGFLNDRLSIEATYFHKKGIDQILGLPVPGSLGADGPDVNVGALLNTGIELATEARLLTRENIALQLRGSLATLHNELLDLGGVPESSTRKVGFPLSGEWDYRIKSVDLANNRVIVSDTLEFIGNDSNYPGWDAALSGTLTLFHNLSFYAQMDGRGDRMVFDGTTEFRDRQFGQSEAAVRGAVAYGANPDGTPTEAAQTKYLRRFGPFYNESGERLNRSTVDGDYLQDGTFFRLREASVNYSVPSSFIRKYVRARSAVIGLTMKNLATWTDFTGLDPETDQFLTVPSDRRWTMRVLFTF
jgi:TonB-linked SusC/RagA family outer membrane protein